MIPTHAQLRAWIDQCDKLFYHAATTNYHHDLHTVMCRLEDEHTRKPPRLVQGGCAFRLLRMASALRSSYPQTAQTVYQLASEVVQCELAPSPDWSTMCAEFGWSTP